MTEVSQKWTFVHNEGRLFESSFSLSSLSRVGLPLKRMPRPGPSIIGLFFPKIWPERGLRMKPLKAKTLDDHHRWSTGALSGSGMHLKTKIWFEFWHHLRPWIPGRNDIPGLFCFFFKTRNHPGSQGNTKWEINACPHNPLRHLFFPREAPFDHEFQRNWFSQIVGRPVRLGGLPFLVLQLLPEWQVVHSNAGVSQTPPN